MPWEMDWAGPTTPVQSEPKPQNPWQMDWTQPAPTSDAAPEKPFGITDTWPFRLGRGMYEAAKSAVTLPGDVYTGKVDPNAPEAVGRELNFAALAMPQSVGRMAVSPTPAVAPTEEALKSAGAQGYQLARDSNVALKGRVVGSWAERQRQNLFRRGFSNNSAPDTHTVIDTLTKYASDTNKLTAGDYIDLRQTLQDIARQVKEGRPTRDAAAASKVIKQLDGFFDTASPQAFVAGTPTEIGGVRTAIKDARGNFSAGFRSELLTRKEHEADLLSATANSGKNYDNAMRRKLAGVALSPKSAGYSPEELTAIEQTARKPAVGVNALRDISNRLGGGGGLGASVVGGLTGGYFGGGDPLTTLTGMAIPQVVGGAMKAGENYLTKRAVNKLTNTLRLRSPAGEQAAASQYRPPPQRLPMASEEALRLLTLYQLQNPDQM